ncbi:Neurochondrin-domain-containing protein [Dichotomocladium elegans]|nr:Neurochondrin-domain-containing protein [Dichotomocladium elegans]
MRLWPPQKLWPIEFQGCPPSCPRNITRDTSDTNKEALHVMLCVSVSKEGLVRMLDRDVLKNVFEFVAATNSKQERQLGMQLVLNAFSRACHMLHEKPVPSLASALKYALPVLLTALSKLLSRDQSSLKFDALETLSGVLPDIPDEVMRKFKVENAAQVNTWLQDLRSGLRQLLSNKLVDKQRDEAMVVAACLLRHFGPDWLFSSLKKTKSSKRKSEKKPISEPSTQEEIDTKFPVLFIHLVAVEARVILDDIHDRYLKLHNREVVAVNPEKEQRQETMLPIFYEILESVIQYLSSNYHEDRETGIDSEILLKIRTTLTDTLNIVMEFLRFIQDTSTDEELEKDMIAQASMRIVALYLAEEGYEL